MAGGKPRLPFTQTDAIDAAEKLAYLSKRFRDLAAEMEKRKRDSVESGSVKMLRASFGNMTNAVNAVYLALDQTMLESGAFAEREKK